MVGEGPFLLLWWKNCIKGAGEELLSNVSGTSLCLEALDGDQCGVKPAD